MSTYNLLHLIWTVVLFAIFVGIAVWAWSGRQRSRFERAAQAPFDDETMTESDEAIVAEAEETAFVIIQGERATRRSRAPGRRTWLTS